MHTSISDNQIYPAFCLASSHDLRIFYAFRQNKIYRQILEHVSAEQGASYLKEIEKDAEIMHAIEP